MSQRTKNVIRAHDIMTNHFLEIDGLKTVHEALQIMRSNRVDAMIVKRRDDNDEHGIVVLSDIARKVLAADRAPERVNLYEIMTKPVVGVDPGMDVRYVARLFDRFQLSQAPVISDGRVVGLISYSELVLRGLAPPVTDES